MAGTVEVGTLLSSGARSIDVDDIGVRSYAGGGGAFNYRNKLVDGRFDFWYEGTTQTTSGYGSDTMRVNEHVGSSKTHTQQVLTPGIDLPSIEVPSAKYYSRTVVSTVTGTSNYVKKIFRMEDARTLAGKSSVLSFYARAGSTKNIAIELYQHFSDTSSKSTPLGLVSLSTEWKRYKIKFDVPSMAGKTIDSTPNYVDITFWFDAGSSLSIPSSSLGQQSGTFDIACVQLEEGSVATPFEELPPDIARQRLDRYFVAYVANHDHAYVGLCYWEFAQVARMAIPNTFRALPTLTMTGRFQFEQLGGAVTGIEGIGLSSSEVIRVGFFSTNSVTIGQASAVRVDNDWSARMFFDARM